MRELKILFLYFLLSIVFDFSLTCVAYFKNPEDVIRYEANPIARDIFKGNLALIPLLILAQIPSISLILSFAYLYKKTKQKRYYVIACIICIVLANPHVFWGLTWFLF